MHKLPCVLAAMLGVAASTVAQNCTTPPAQRTISNREDFGASFYYTLGGGATGPTVGGCHMLDMNVQRNIAIDLIRTWTYDSGIGNPPTPNQVGATGTVNFYTCPTTRIGNETNMAAWTLLGAGTITIVATPGESGIVFAPPLNLPAGQYGVALQYLPTTTGPAPGVLHCLGVSPNPNTTVSDQFVTLSNDGIQGTAFVTAPTDSPNLRIRYTPDAASAHYVTVGEGCYYRPEAFYENFPAVAPLGMPDIANTGQVWVNVGTNYVVAAGSSAIVPPIVAHARRVRRVVVGELG
jgi:hypothetical protein